MPTGGRENPDAFKTLLKKMESLNGVQTQAGWFPSAVYPDGRPVAAVAEGNEFGISSRSIPPRPFMRPTIAEKMNAWKDVALQLSQRVVSGKLSAYGALDLLGAEVAANIADTITRVTSPALSKITLGARLYRQQGKKVTGKTIGEIARKIDEGKLDVSGVSDKPLVDSSLMVDTVSHEVEKV